MLEFEEYKVKLNNIRPALDALKDALKLEAAGKEIEELEKARRKTMPRSAPPGTT